MKHEKIVPILDGYDELGKLIELATRLKKVWGQLGWYIEHVERRISKIMKSQDRVNCCRELLHGLRR
jgi:hypothetical protein